MEVRLWMMEVEDSNHGRLWGNKLNWNGLVSTEVLPSGLDNQTQNLKDMKKCRVTQPGSQKKWVAYLEAITKTTHAYARVPYFKTVNLLTTL